MAKELNHNRVEFYQANDLAYDYYRDRIVEIISSASEYSFVTINDCIEIHQVLQTVRAYPHLFIEYDQGEVLKPASNLFSSACAVASGMLADMGLLSLFDSIEEQYVHRFWDFSAESKLYKSFSKLEIQSLLKTSLHVIRDMLRHRQLLNAFDDELAEALKASPRYAAELIIDTFGAAGERKGINGLPSSLTHRDIDNLMLAFLSEEKINLNHVRVLSMWPSSAKGTYRPSPKVLVTAAQRIEELTKELFQSKDAIIIKGDANVLFSPSQKECKQAVLDDGIIKCSFSTLWLMEYTDYGTILNNFIYVFGFAKTVGLLTVPAHKHERSILMETLGLHPLDEYHESPQSRARLSLQLCVIMGYRRLLIEAGTRLEDALEWFFNSYISEEFGIEGFRINLPAENVSFFDKCKSSGPEIERVLKAFQVYVCEGEVNPAYFPHIGFKLFDQVPSLVSKKYLIEDKKFAGYGQMLFSDQSQLAYSKRHEGHDSFFEMIESDYVVFEDFHDVYQPILARLEKDGFICRDDSGRINAEERTWVLYWIWKESAFPVYRFSGEIKAIADDLVENGFARYSESLFSPDESDYLNYMFNNAKFSGSIGLRNEYDHASGIVTDPNDESIEQDYCLFLDMLICIVLKINDELMFVTGKGGVGELVDWPLADEDS